ncbi:hypothetical protein [Marinobacterium aestuariivivens]|uniref:Uncharacterized protein n=1 Tax=Marinobacterium aestuariivivens TaxID=1698799 RepID=A0ABW2A9T0_9GAMM
MKRYELIITERDVNEKLVYLNFGESLRDVVEKAVSDFEGCIIISMNNVPTEKQLESIGYSVREDSDLPGYWYFTDGSEGSDISHETRDAAAVEAFNHFIQSAFPLNAPAPRSIGEEVTWIDPDDGHSSGVYEVVKKSGEVYFLRSEAGVEVEALAHELR